MKKYLIPIVVLTLSLSVLSAGWARAEPGNAWLIKSKKPSGSQTIFVVWQDGSLTAGEPFTLTVSENIAEVETLKGQQYVQAKQWFTSGSGRVYTPWQGKPIAYGVESLGGKCRVGLSAKNFTAEQGWSLPKKYKNFKIVVKVDDVKVGKIFVPASDKEVKTGYLTLSNIQSGAHKLEFIWKNDKYKPNKKWDANLEIHKVTFEKFR